MGKAHRWVGFLASVVSASLVYIICLAVSLEFEGPRDIHNGVFTLGFAIVFWFFGGMAAALVLMVLPWVVVVQVSDRLRCFNPLYFALSGAVMILLLGCGTSSLAPKPLFVEDQSFIEGFLITAERQGIDLLLTGLVFGLTFWLMSERSRHSRSVKAP
jgi:hypothetical protein